MKTGDPKKAKILGAVAVGAIAFVVIELMPAPSKHKGTVAPKFESTPSEKVAIASNALLRDPFSSKLLIVKPVSKTSSGSSADPGGDTSGKESPKGLVGSLPSASADGKSSSADLGSGPFPIGLTGLIKGKETAVTNQTNIPGHKTVIKLEATMTVNQPVAMISVDSAEAMPFHAGQKPFKGILLKSVGMDGITLSVNGSSKHLDVGKEISL